MTVAMKARVCPVHFNTGNEDSHLERAATAAERQQSCRVDMTGIKYLMRVLLLTCLLLIGMI